MVLALGFGAAQAFAAPGARRPRQAAADTCSGTRWNACYYQCRPQGFMGGTCELYKG